MANTPDPEIFTQAADHIRRNGLHRGYYYPVDMDVLPDPERATLPEFAEMPMDVVGAIAYVGNGHPVPGARWSETIAGKAVMWAEVYAEAHDLLDCEISIPAWCDGEGRTAEEAVRLLKTLAEGARGVAP